MELVLSAWQLGGEPFPWWLRFGVVVYAGLAVAAFMVFAQTRHRRPWSILWPLVIAFVPLGGAVVYLTVATVSHRRRHPRPSKGRAERMPPEERGDGTEHQP